MMQILFWIALAAISLLVLVPGSAEWLRTKLVLKKTTSTVSVPPAFLDKMATAKRLQGMVADCPSAGELIKRAMIQIIEHDDETHDNTNTTN